MAENRWHRNLRLSFLVFTNRDSISSLSHNTYIHLKQTLGFYAVLPPLWKKERRKTSFATKGAQEMYVQSARSGMELTSSKLENDCPEWETFPSSPVSRSATRGDGRTVTVFCALEPIGTTRDRFVGAGGRLRFHFALMPGSTLVDIFPARRSTPS
mmetsp:Transcript_7518/g.13093  ORF Transcript_7518/g.13093 Transcript_7518/m.13093 type:complete len:156 (+) Transcript_7518:514-981(+)